MSSKVPSKPARTPKRQRPSQQANPDFASGEWVMLDPSGKVIGRGSLKDLRGDVIYTLPKGGGLYHGLLHGGTRIWTKPGQPERIGPAVTPEQVGIPASSIARVVHGALPARASAAAPEAPAPAPAVDPRATPEPSAERIAASPFLRAAKARLDAKPAGFTDALFRARRFPDDVPEIIGGD